MKEWADSFRDAVIQRVPKSQMFMEWDEKFVEWRRFLENDEIDDRQIEVSAERFFEEANLLVDRQNMSWSIEYVPIGGHTLPPLPYDYDALEPYIEEEIMRLHHDIHHQSYVDGLNNAEKMMEMARETGNYQLLKHWEREAAFHGSGHYLHTIFWENMKPNGEQKPSGDLLNQIEQDFGSYEKFKEQFTNAANQVEGVGWAVLVWSPRSRRLEILQSERHQFMTQWDTIPLLVLDVWEHAYYLQYKNERSKYVQNWWNIVNWDNVEGRFAAAKELQWKPY
ncbi:superoxide dismutase [Bacillus solimangrovi]|uniref:superoxide dismutase n=2 Tax=Bacillus solimangrovi TaxID=1305675 RepID=A0A1E5LHW3_9BACI|nr:superoxide dismutase [Bacillus solimangrovi]